MAGKIMLRFVQDGLAMTTFVFTSNGVILEDATKQWFEAVTIIQSSR